MGFFFLGTDFLDVVYQWVSHSNSHIQCKLHTKIHYYSDIYINIFCKTYFYNYLIPLITNKSNLGNIKLCKDVILTYINKQTWIFTGDIILCLYSIHGSRWPSNNENCLISTPFYSSSIPTPQFIIQIYIILWLVFYSFCQVVCILVAMKFSLISMNIYNHSILRLFNNIKYI